MSQFKIFEDYFLKDGLKVRCLYLMVIPPKIINIMFTLNGQKISNLNSIKNAVERMVAEGIEKKLRQALSPLSSQMTTEGTKIEVDIKTGKIKFTNASSKLGEKITEILNRK